ncbi:uncharacterized protein [Aristolochia californica]|uniref:uncharacterized protein n=1 Tax=Aristolochia californica TaxID=171875 RepID=UPI0035DD5188
MSALNETMQHLIWRVEEGLVRGQTPPSSSPILAETHHPHPPPPPPPLRHQNPPTIGPHSPGLKSVPRYAKLDFPTFDGSKDPLIWLHRCDQFFYNQITNAADWVHLAAFHMLDEVLLWYHQFQSTHHAPDWDLFKEYCMLRFDPPTRSNPLGDLVNLKQTGTIELYQKYFQERLARAS